jgi:hypothetical protein
MSTFCFFICINFTVQNYLTIWKFNFTGTKILWKYCTIFTLNFENVLISNYYYLPYLDFSKNSYIEFFN